LNKPFSRDSDWSWMVGYTYTNAEEVSALTSSTAGSGFGSQLGVNINEPTSSTARYEIKDRFSGALNWQHKFFGDHATQIGLFYEGRSGRPFSYAFANDANGDGQANDLFYIPLSPSDVAYTAGSSVQDRAAFNDYIATHQNLVTHRGQVAERNGARAPFVNQFDLRLSQKLPFFGDRQSEIYLDIQNVGNLINKSWGQIEEAGFPSRVQMARFAGVNPAGQYVYDVSTFYNEATGTATVPTLELKDVVGESRWSAQVGFKINF
jgi:hypothetical protein